MTHFKNRILEIDKREKKMSLKTKQIRFNGILLVRKISEMKNSFFAVNIAVKIPKEKKQKNG